MGLVVEDGTGVNNANSYVAADAFDDFLTDRDQASDATAGERVASLLRACEALEGRYGTRWIGERATTRTDRLSWPRVNAVDVEDRDFSGEVPELVKTAQMLLAVQDFEDEPLDAPLGAAETRLKADVVEVEYAAPEGSKVERRFAHVERLLAPLLKVGRGDGIASRMRRY